MKLIEPTAEALMDVLAADAEEIDYKGIVFLCSQWEVKPVLMYPTDGGRPYYNWPATIAELARHVRKAEEHAEKIEILVRSGDGQWFSAGWVRDPRRTNPDANVQPNVDFNTNADPNRFVDRQPVTDVNRDWKPNAHSDLDAHQNANLHNYAKRDADHDADCDGH